MPGFVTHSLLVRVRVKLQFIILDVTIAVEDANAKLVDVEAGVGENRFATL